jgi:hypothetical protein
MYSILSIGRASSVCDALFFLLRLGVLSLFVPSFPSLLLDALLALPIKKARILCLDSL